MNSVSERIIFALDCANKKEAQSWIDRLWPEVRFFKVGLELFLSAGWPIIEYIQSKGGKVMLDLKFLDIPTTVTKAVQQCAGRDITFVTVHGYRQTVAAAVEGKGKDSMKILAVTLLTSQANVASSQTAEELVLARAKDSLTVGCEGLVASPLEARILRERFGQKPILVTPGIRDREDAKNEQQRFTDVATAVAAGSDYLVVGRPIRLAAEPLAKVKLIKEQIAAKI